MRIPFFSIFLLFSSLVFSNEGDYLDSKWTGAPIEEIQKKIKEICHQKCEGDEEQKRLASLAKEIESQYINDFKNWVTEMPPNLRSVLQGLTYDEEESPSNNEVSQPHRLREIFDDEEFMDILIEDHNFSPPINKDQLLESFTRYYNSLGALSVLKYECINSNPSSKDACPLKTNLPRLENIPYEPTPKTGKSSGGSKAKTTAPPTATPPEKISDTDPRCQDIVSKAITLDEQAGELAPREYMKRKRELSKCVNWCSVDLKKKLPHLCSQNGKPSDSNTTPYASLDHSDKDSIITTDGQSISCDTGWLTQPFKKRNWNELMVDCAVTGTSLEIFKDEYYELLGTTARAILESQAGQTTEGDIFKEYISGQSNYINYPDLVRMTGVSKFLQGNCDLLGETPSNIPPSCAPYKRGIDKFECKKKIVPDKKKYIETAKKLTKLYQIKKKLNEQINSELFKGIRNFINTGVTPPETVLRGISLVQAYQNYSSLKEQINQIDANIVQLSGVLPLLMSELKTNTPIEDQDLTEAGVVKKFSKMDSRNIDEEQFNTIFEAAKLSASKNFRDGLDRMCDSQNGITNDQIILMPELTAPTLKTFPQYEVAQLCLELRFGPEDMKELINDLAVPGAALLCLGASLGPQAVAVGAACGLMFAGHGYHVYKQQQGKLIQLQDCRRSTTGTNLCDDETYLKQVSDYHDAVLNLKISIATLPLDIILPGAIEYGPDLVKALRSIEKLPVKRATQFAKEIDEEILAIKKMSNPKKQAKALDKLLKKIKSQNNFKPISVTKGSEGSFYIIIKNDEGRSVKKIISPGATEAKLLDNHTVVQRNLNYVEDRINEDGFRYPLDPLFTQSADGLTDRYAFDGVVAHGISFPENNPSLEIFKNGDNYLYPKLERANEIYQRLDIEFRNIGLSNNIKFIDDSFIGSADNFYQGLENLIRQAHCPGQPVGSLCWPMGTDGVFHLHDIGTHYSKIYQIPDDIVRQLSLQARKVSEYLDFLDNKYVGIETRMNSITKIKDKVKDLKMPDGTYDLEALTSFYSSNKLSDKERELFDSMFDSELIFDPMTGDMILEIPTPATAEGLGSEAVKLDFDKYILNTDIELRGIKQIKFNLVKETGEQIELVGTGKIRKESRLLDILEYSPKVFLRKVTSKTPEIPRSYNQTQLEIAEYSIDRFKKSSRKYFLEFTRKNKGLDVIHSEKSYWEYEQIMETKEQFVQSLN